jgi:hypothetical protein
VPTGRRTPPGGRTRGARVVGQVAASPNWVGFTKMETATTSHSGGPLDERTVPGVQRAHGGDHAHGPARLPHGVQGLGVLGDGVDARRRRELSPVTVRA